MARQNLETAPATPPKLLLQKPPVPLKPPPPKPPVPLKPVAARPPSPLQVAPLQAAPLQPARPQVAPPQAAPPRPDGSSIFAWAELQNRRRRFWVIGASVALAGVSIVALLLLRSSPASDAGSLAGSAGANSADAPAASGIPAAASPQDRERLLETVKYKEWASGEEVLVRLLQSGPAAFRDAEVKKAAAMIAVKVAFRGDARGEQIFEALEKKLGVDGFDVLYEMVSGYGGSKGADRALEILRRPDVLGRLSPPLKIAVELREAPCKEKPSLFKRAAREGDERVMLVLELLRPPQCKPKTGQCCFRNEPALEEALTTLRARPRSTP